MKKIALDYLNDGLGRKIEKLSGGKLVARYIYDNDGRLIAELDKSGKLKSRFVYATMLHAPDYMIQNGVKYKFIHDQLGSVLNVINSQTGKSMAKFSYDEFGNSSHGHNSGFEPFGFAGGIFDSDTKLVRFGVRDYDPETGRWTSKDPILFKGGDTNLYGYVLADPINKIDPSGLFTTCVVYFGGAGVCFNGDDPLHPQFGQLPPSRCPFGLCFFPHDDPPIRPPSRDPWLQPPIANNPPGGAKPPNSCSSQNASMGL